MKTKIIPFDFETAKKIQAGEIKGKITTKLGESVRIVLEADKGNYPIITLIYNGENEEARCYSLKGELFEACNLHAFDLVLEVPDNKPQFKPFDRVLVRNQDDECWHPSLYATTDGLLYYTIDCKNWTQCIHYEGNEELLGTTKKPKKE